MADNRSASRQRKTNQNRAARQSLATRRAAAAEKAAAQAKAEDEADKAVAKALKTQPKGGSKTVAKRSTGKATGSLKTRATVKDDVIDDDEVDTSRPSRTSGARSRVRDDEVDDDPRARGRRAPRGPSPVPDHEPGLAGWFAGVREVPGGTAVIASVVLGLLAFVFFTFVFKFPQGPFNTIASGAKGLAPPEKQTGAELGGAVGIVISLLPVVVSVVALLYALRPQRRKVWLICVFVTLAMVTLGAGTAGLPCVIALGWGYYKTSKAEREI